jgi:hypothetical protein
MCSELVLGLREVPSTPRCGGFPTAMTRRKVKGELWAGVTPSGRSPVTWAPVKGALRAVKPREEGLIPSNIKPNETRTPASIHG